MKKDTKAVAVQATPEERERLKQVMAECRMAFAIDAFEARYGWTRQQAREFLERGSR